MAPSDMSYPSLGTDHELRPILHEEIDRLPEAHRLPVVLCDLEGLTYEQAAQRLRCTEQALCYRLAKARTRLRDRLSRRGVTAIVTQEVEWFSLIAVDTHSWKLPAQQPSRQLLEVRKPPAPELAMV